MKIENPREDSWNRARECYRWVGPYVAAEECDLDFVNRQLRDAGKPAFRRRLERFYEEG